MEHLEGVEGEGKDKKEESSVEEGNVDAEVKKENRLLDTRLIALFIIGALVGITLKTHAIQNITMGFEDYKLQNLKSDFGLSPGEEELVEEEQTTGEAEELIEGGMVEESEVVEVAPVEVGSDDQE